MELKNLIRIVAAYLLVWGASSTFSQTPGTACDRDAHSATELGELFGRGHTIASTEYPYPVGRDGTRYLRLRLEVVNPLKCDWYLTIRDNDHNLIQSLSAEDFQKSPNQWTSRIYGSSAFLDLEPCREDPKAPVIKLQEYLAMPVNTERNPYYSTQHSIPEWRPLYLGDTRFRPWGDFVGLLMGSWNSKTVWTCSGVMIANDLFLTNWHCGSPRTLGDGTPDNPIKAYPEDGYWADEILKDTIIDTSWDKDSLSRDFTVTGVAACSKRLDFAILEVRPVTSLGRVRPVRISSVPISDGDPLWIVQHPLAMPKQISNCTVVSARSAGWRPESGQVDFTHQCDTEAGSSGAPVFNSQGELVGIHHKGFELDMQTCQPLLPKLNRAVRIDEIMTFLCDTPEYTSIYDRISRK